MNDQSSRIIRASGAADVARKPDALSRRDFMLLSGAVAASTLLPGCGGGGTSGGSRAFFSANNVVVKPNVVVLPDDKSVTLSNITDTSVTLSGKVPSLQPGTMLVSGESPGMLRKVISVSQNGGATTLVTEMGSFDQLFESADVQFRQPLTLADVASIDNHGFDVNNNRSAGAPVTRSPDVDIPLHFRIKVGKDKAPKEGVAEVRFDGHFSADLACHPVYIGGELESFEITCTTVIAGTAKGTGKFAIPLFKEEINYQTYLFTPIFLGNVGPVPVFLLPVLSLDLACNGKFEVGAEAECPFTLTNVTGFRLIKNGSGFDRTNIQHSSFTGDPTIPNLFADLKFEFTPLQVDLQTSFDGVIGPFVKVSTPTFELKLKGFASGPTAGDVDGELNAIVRATVGAKAGLGSIEPPGLPKVFSSKFPLFEVAFVDEKFPIKKITFDSGTGDISVH
ncbi:MAG: hypothetical protein ABJA67_03465 [Chthonomonadales bacterium]